MLLKTSYKENMKKLEVSKHGFYGIFHKAYNEKDNEKVVIVLGGSEGNEKIPMEIGRMFAENGISALGMCYWNVEGLPSSIVRVPLEPFEHAIEWLKKEGYKKIYIYGISKGAELALLCASLMPNIIGVIAISPSHCVWGGINGNGSMFAKSFTEYSEFTWKGKDIPCIKVKTKYFKLFLNLIKEQQINMCYLYENALKNFDEAAAIRVEDIKGDILFIYPKEDTMWPSKVSVNYMMERLRKKHFTYQVQSIEYERASHILVPLNPSKLKMFKVERRYSDDCKKNRQEAFEKSVKWIDER